MNQPLNRAAIGAVDSCSAGVPPLPRGRLAHAQHARGRSLNTAALSLTDLGLHPCALLFTMPHPFQPARKFVLRFYD